MAGLGLGGRGVSHTTQNKKRKKEPNETRTITALFRHLFLTSSRNSPRKGSLKAKGKEEKKGNSIGKVRRENAEGGAGPMGKKQVWNSQAPNNNKLARFRPLVQARFS